MARVINPNSPSKVRNHHLRTAAEILRLVSQKSTIDDEAKDMAAFLVYAFREIYDGAEESAQAWEKRGYWMKSERFLREWRWTIEIAADIEDVLRHDAWDLLPNLFASLFPRVAKIELKRMIRKPQLWQGTYTKLMAEEPRPLPY